MPYLKWEINPLLHEVSHEIVELWFGEGDWTEAFWLPLTIMVSISFYLLGWCWVVTLILGYKGQWTYRTEALVFCGNRKVQTSYLLPNVIPKRHFWGFAKGWVLGCWNELGRASARLPPGLCMPQGTYNLDTPLSHITFCSGGNILYPCHPVW